MFPFYALDTRGHVALQIICHHVFHHLSLCVLFNILLSYLHVFLVKLPYWCIHQSPTVDDEPFFTTSPLVLNWHHYSLWPMQLFPIYLSFFS